MNKEKLLTNKIVVVFLAVFASILWGSAFPVLKISFEELQIPTNEIWGKMVFAGIRFLGSSIILFFIIFIFRIKEKINIQIFKFLFLLGLLHTFLQYFFFYIGVSNTSGMKSAILISSNTFFVVLLSHFIYHNDKLNWKKLLGLITGLFGIIFANWGADLSLSFNFYGEGFLLLSGLVSAIGTILAKKLSNNINPILVLAVQMFFGSSMLLLLGIPNMNQSLNFTPTATILLIYSMFLSSVAFGIWYSILKYNKAGEISIYRFVIPVSGASLSAIFLIDEMFNPFLIISLTLVAFGIFIINYKKYDKIEV